MRRPEVARIFGVHPLTINAWMRKYGIRKEPRAPITDSVIAKIERARQAERARKPLTAAEAAPEAGIPATVIFYYLRVLGIPKKHGKNQFTPEVIARLRTAYAAHRCSRSKTAKEVASVLGVSVKVLYQRLKRHGIRKRRFGGFTPEVIAALKEAVAGERATVRLSAAEVARRIGASPSHVGRTARRFGVPRLSGRRPYTAESVDLLKALIGDRPRRRRRSPAASIPKRPMTISEAAEILGVARGTVHRRMLRHGFSPRTGLLSPSLVRRLGRPGPHPGHMTLGETCRRLGISSPTVYRMLRQHRIGIPKAPFGFTAKILAALRRARALEQKRRAMSGREAAGKLGLTVGRMLYLMRKRGVPRPRQRFGFTPRTLLAIRRVMAQQREERRHRGRSIKEVAAELGLSGPIIYELLRKHGIHKKPGVRTFDARVMLRLRKAARQRRQMMEQRRRQRRRWEYLG